MLYAWPAIPAPLCMSSNCDRKPRGCFAGAPRSSSMQGEAAKRALVTGGSGGIGSAICRQLSAAGHFVYVHANRGKAAADALVAEIIAAGGGASAVYFDVTDAAATRSALDGILEEAPVQILVNNAGIHDDAPFPGMSPLQWHSVVEVAVDGFYNVTQPLMMPM